MTKTIQDAFQKAVLANKKSDSKVLARYGADLDQALVHFIKENKIAAAKMVLDLGGSLHAHRSQALAAAISKTENDDNLARLHFLIEQGVKANIDTVKAVIDKDNLGVFHVIKALPEINIPAYDLKRDLGVLGMSDRMALALIEAGAIIDTSSLNDFVRNKSLAVVERHLQAGVKPNITTIREAIIARKPDIFEKVFSAAAQEEWSEKTLEEFLGYAAGFNQLQAFRKFIELGAKPDPTTFLLAEKAAKVLQKNPEDYCEENRAGDIITIYKECCQLTGQQADEALCKAPKILKHKNAVLVMAGTMGMTPNLD